MNKLYNKEWAIRWDEMTELKHCKKMQPTPETKTNTKRGRTTLNHLFQIITGHCLMKGHMSKWKGGSPKCPWCSDLNKKPYHYWGKCPAYTYDKWASDMITSKGKLGRHDPYLVYFRQHHLLDAKNANDANT